jgi:hypothetical protein
MKAANVQRQGRLRPGSHVKPKQVGRPSSTWLMMLVEEGLPFNRRGMRVVKRKTDVIARKAGAFAK